ncbi:GntR family transcriptional regulator [Terrarubrum flagellatum]|uniref:GntR family transcriptional regulator n=1 Tax=Terrirubrum flagellatum TaxID=2895980 RepID=UPI0031453E8D
MPKATQKRAASPLRLLKQDSLSERIYLDLRARLQRCEIGTEDRLVDLEIADVYGTSRMPAREALIRLANEGYLVGTTRGFVTPKLTLDDIRDIFEVRKLLEPQAAANAARDLDDRGRERLTRAIEQARAAAHNDDVDGLILANIDFRSCWLGALKNSRLANTLARFADHVQTVRLGTLRDHDTRGIVSSGLEELYDALSRKDSTAAADRMMAFIMAAERAFYSMRKAEIEREQVGSASGRPAAKKSA